MARKNFADSLMEAVRRKKSQVVVGLDPRPDRLPCALQPDDLQDTAAAADSILAFNQDVLDAVAEEAAAVKCQIAFYEQLGCEGMRTYARTLKLARERDLIVIGDVKRSDIASTAEAYAAAHLGPAPGGYGPCDDFVADAITVNPYLGSDGIRPFLEAAAAHGRGLFALVKTSNPSSIEIQDLVCGGAPLYERVGELVEEWGAQYRGHAGYSAVGAVVGATFPDELERLRRQMPHTIFLVPGFGAQGGEVEQVLPAFDADGEGAIVNSSRGIIFAWQSPPYDESHGESRWRDAVRAAAADMRKRIWNATH